MTDRNLFMETLREVAEIVRTSATPMSKEEMLSFFKDMDLTDEQKDMVFNYLITPQNEEEEAVAESVDYTDIPDTKEPEESAFFRMYLDDVAKLKEYQDEQLGMMYVKLLSGDYSVSETIFLAWLKKVIDIAKGIEKRGVNLEDVVQEGNMALCIRLRELCNSKAAIDVEADLKEKIIEAMKLYISSVTGSEDGEETIAGKANLVKEAMKYLEETNKAKPDIRELSEFTHIDEEELRDIINIMDKALEKGKK